MVLYKLDCDSNDCKLPNGKATPSILAIEVWLMRLHVGLDHYYYIVMISSKELRYTE